MKTKVRLPRPSRNRNGTTNGANTTSQHCSEPTYYKSAQTSKTPDFRSTVVNSSRNSRTKSILSSLSCHLLSPQSNRITMWLQQVWLLTITMEEDVFMGIVRL